MTHQIHIAIEDDREVDEDALSQAVVYTLQTTGADASGLSVVITTAEHVHELNRQYAGIDSTTDVLSFPAEDDTYAVEPGEPPYIGDIFVARPVAEKQAAERGHSLLSELQILVIHGTLHLLGYDHDTPDNQALMWAMESASLNALRAGASS